MKSSLFIVLLLCSHIVFAQDRLGFVRDEKVKKEIQNSIEFFTKTKLIPIEIKYKTVFISFYFEELLEVENLSVSYSTYTPTQFAILSNRGQFETSPANKILYFNYSPSIVLVFENGFKNLDQQRMAFLSEQFCINEENVMDFEYFKFQKGNEITADIVENFIRLDKIDGEYVPTRLSTFDLKTFVEVWYGIDVSEISVKHKKNKGE
ncbi:hypothetical protein [Chryseobacterium sp. MFBS3-17]|uniref:hypothetical protein n=1 Tax=Chryseobacterium sp. MFBS3-17 TaxID=2886689 RepID=UPI001D0E75B1|nr:hypothetical protein [Chryseobacterium sp. MFBS3-17]MCC2590258.1 hypothetical protein [Chryseobacterium sp. MFBS3-17]